MALLAGGFRRSIFADKMTWLIVGALSLMVSGLTLNNGTTAFFTNTAALTGDSFTTAKIDLSGSSFTSVIVNHIVPADVFYQPVSVVNTATAAGGIGVNYYLTVKDTTSGHTYPFTSKVTDTTNGLKLAAIRCYSDSGGASAAACSSSTLQSLKLISGVHGGSPSAVAFNGATGCSGGCALSTVLSVSPSTGDLRVLTTGSATYTTLIAAASAVPAVTAGNSNCGGTSTNDGACLVAVPSGQSVNNPAVAAVTHSGTSSTFDIPAAGSAATGLAQGGTDNFGLLFYLPISATQTNITELNSAATVAVLLTGVQPNGVTTAGTGSAVAVRT